MDDGFPSPERVGFEAEVRSRLRRGDLSGGSGLAIQRLEPRIRAYLRTMLDETDTEAALSVFREGLWKGLPGFRWECSLRAWAYKVARGAAVRILREPHRRREEHLPSSAASRLAASLPPLGPSSTGRHANLEHLRQSLPPEDLELLALRIDAELEWAEIAAVLEREHGQPVAPATLRKRFERLTKRLERMAREQGLID